jgi:Tol biopolymer transport system component
MPLANGDRLGPYEIVAAIGAGGMGEVYRARDTRLGRDVALKLLAGAVADDVERQQRFAREAHAVAALNHPNIVTIHSVEAIDGRHFLTMELVDGRALSDLIPPAGLPIDRLLKIGIQLADAIGAAHQRGITHRDLKPSNVMVTTDGRAKVMDFGLAAYRPHQTGGESLVTSPALTQAGVILGTVAYMSPEQAEGKAVDERSDIFSLGVTLYEMATGRRPFTGDSGLSVMSSILRDNPRPITDINPALPAGLSRIVRRCLDKDPDRRYHSAKDVRNDLAELTDAPGLATDASTSRASVPLRRSSPAAGIAAAVGAAGVALGVLLSPWLRSFGLDDRPTGAPPVFSQLTWDAGIELYPSLSPDGKWLVYAGDASGNRDIYLQSVGGQTAINLTSDSPADDRQPAFSPDGERIVFRSERDGGGIFVMGRTGEATRRVADTGFNPAWSPDGASVVVATEDVVLSPQSRGPNSTLAIVTVATGERRELKTGDAVQPAWSPDGRWIAHWTTRGPGRQRDIAVVPAAGGDAVIVTDDPPIDWNPVWAPDGRHLYFLSDRGGIMSPWRVAIDGTSGRAIGSPEPVTVPSPSVAHLTYSANGRQLAFASIETSSNVDRLELDAAAGAFTGAPVAVTSGSRPWWLADESPDGRWLALGTAGPFEDLFIIRTDGTGLRQITSDAAVDRFPRWSPDGRRIAFQSNRRGSWEVWAINTDGSGLTALTEKLMGHRPVWSPTGDRLVFNDFLLENKAGIIDPRNPSTEQKVERLPPVADAKYWFVTDWSPDGRWLAGYRDRGGIVVYSFDSQQIALLTETGDMPFWLPDSRRMLFHDGAAMAILDRETRQARAVRPATIDRPLALSRDGRRVYVARSQTRSDIWTAVQPPR